MVETLPGRLPVPGPQRHTVTVDGEPHGSRTVQQRPHRVDERRGHDDLHTAPAVPGDTGPGDSHPVPVGGHDVEALALDVEQDRTEHGQLRIGTRSEPNRVQRGRQLGRGDGQPDGGDAERSHVILPVIE